MTDTYDKHKNPKKRKCNGSQYTDSENRGSRVRYKEWIETESTLRFV